jgi:hypothetical protein
VGGAIEIIIFNAELMAIIKYNYFSLANLKIKAPSSSILDEQGSPIRLAFKGPICLK